MAPLTVSKISFNHAVVKIAIVENVGKMHR